MMASLIVCGLNTNGSSIEKREQIAMPKHCLIPALRSLARLNGVVEAVILSTCNRTEVYLVCESSELGLLALRDFFAQVAGKHGGEVRPNLTASGDDAILHLFSVASGFDSIVIGEGQILSQVGEALAIAQQGGTSGPLLNKLFNLAAYCGKRVRSQTGIARKAVSVASAAVELAQQFGGLQSTGKALIIGAGQMGTLCAKHVISKSNVALTVFNPSEARLNALTATLKRQNRMICATTDPAELRTLCDEADCIFVASGAEHFVLGAEHFAASTHPKLVFDLSMPRNVDPLIGSNSDVTLFSVDDMQMVVQRNLKERQALVAKARPILEVVLEQYHEWMRQREGRNHEYTATEAVAVSPL